MMLIDSHAHLTSSDFEKDLEEVLLRAQKEGVQRIYNICTSCHELEKAITLKEKYPWIFNVGSTTPHDALDVQDSEFKGFESAALAGQLVAIGETGLDYHHHFSPKEKQKELLLRYMDLANRLNLPLVIHCREAFEDLFSLFKDYQGKVLLHCFTGTQDEAQEAVRRGFFISLSGIVTFKKSSDLQKIALNIPLNKLLIETDAPYLAPQSKRGKRNEPAFLKETATFLAHLKNVSEKEFIEATAANTLSFFHDSQI